ncbi:uncharacterized protein LOC114576272 [Exaiptasia diaphana]|uniref:Uncharacterized protein n=1 Tax=Exaiptasia diaphana TaxID=2652724 RepID=A0A913YT71_EXADI|nr:uncharacterized protein LOC114576272 [Exaiptasia diaphana]
MEEEDSKKLDEPASSSQKNMDNTLPNTSNPAVFGHHYYNPQWVMYDKQTPALLYNNAVHFTVSFDGTHYFHEQYQGQFCAPPEATMVVSQQEEAQSKSTRAEGNRYKNENHESFSMWDQPQVLLNPYLNPWQRNSTKPPRRPRKPHHKHKKDSRPKKDVRNTMVPLFPEIFDLGRDSLRW